MYFYTGHVGGAVCAGKEKASSKCNAKIQGATLRKNAQTGIKVFISNEREKQVQGGFWNVKPWAHLCYDARN